MKGRLDFTFNEVIGLFPYACRPVADFILGFEQGSHVRMLLGQTQVFAAEVSGVDFSEGKDAAKMIVVLHELQEIFGQQFPMPSGLTFKDLREMEMLNELMTTGEGRWPYHVLTADIKQDRLGDFLTSDASADGALLAEFEYMSFEVGGHRFDLGATRLYGSHMQLTNLDELRAAVGGRADAKARWRCMEGHHITISRLGATGKP